MDAPAYFMLGFLTYFMLNRFIDALCYRAGRDCAFDCSKCDLHCAGYVCYKHRNTKDGAGSGQLKDDCVTSNDDFQQKLDGLRAYLDSDVMQTDSENQNDSGTPDSD